jgi:uroporphyrinogen decarboxylase
MSPNHENGDPKKVFLSVLDGERPQTPPLWLMRQAGRYLPEYREIRAKARNFLEFCYSPALAAEATLQPIRRFDFDAAILFCDILVIPDALGQKVTFETGEGPRLDPLATASDIERIPEFSLERLSPVFETIDRVRTSLPSHTAFIGFCGAPWTVASYMIAGRGTPDQAPARLFAYRNPAAFQLLIDKLVDASIAYLSEQIRVGIEAVQIFDSWAGVLPTSEFLRWSAEPIARIIAGVRQRHPHARIIAFPRGATTRLPSFVQQTGATALGLDTAVDPEWAAKAIPETVVLQGHLDPLALFAGGKAQAEAVKTILGAYRGRRHIFNLGHGILPETPIEHVTALVRQVRSTEC